MQISVVAHPGDYEDVIVFCSEEDTYDLKLYRFKL